VKVCKILNELMTDFNSQITYANDFYSVRLLGRKHSMHPSDFVHQSVFIMPVNIQSFAWFIFLKKEQCN